MARVPAADREAFLAGLRGTFELPAERDRTETARLLVLTTPGYLGMHFEPPRDAFEAAAQIANFESEVEPLLDVRHRFVEFELALPAQLFQQLPTRPRFRGWLQSIDAVAAGLLALVTSPYAAPPTAARAATALFRVCTAAFEAAQALATERPVQFTGPDVLAAAPLETLLLAVAAALCHLRPLLEDPGVVPHLAPMLAALPLSAMGHLLSTLPHPVRDDDPRRRAAAALRTQHDCLLNVWAAWLRALGADAPPGAAAAALASFMRFGSFITNEYYGAPVDACIVQCLYYEFMAVSKADAAEVPVALNAAQTQAFAALGESLGSLDAYEPGSLARAVVEAALALLRAVCERTLADASAALRALDDAMRGAQGTFWTNELARFAEQATKETQRLRAEEEARLARTARELEAADDDPPPPRRAIDRAG